MYNNNIKGSVLLPCLTDAHSPWLVHLASPSLAGLLCCGGWGMGDGGLSPPIPQPPTPTAKQYVHPSSGTGLGQHLGRLCSPCPCIPLGCTRWVGCGVASLCLGGVAPHRTGKAPQATQAEESDAKATQPLLRPMGCKAFEPVQRNGLGVALQSNAEGGGGPLRPLPVRQNAFGAASVQRNALGVGRALRSNATPCEACEAYPRETCEACKACPCKACEACKAKASFL